MHPREKPLFLAARIGCTKLNMMIVQREAKRVRLLTRKGRIGRTDLNKRT
jgi:hypothetical protein